jgi:hypothetical protein
VQYAPPEHSENSTYPSPWTALPLLDPPPLDAEPLDPLLLLALLPPELPLDAPLLLVELLTPLLPPAS